MLHVMSSWCQNFHVRKTSSQNPLLDHAAFRLLSKNQVHGISNNGFPIFYLKIVPDDDDDNEVVLLKSDADDDDDEDELIDEGIGIELSSSIVCCIFTTFSFHFKPRRWG